MLRSLLYLSLRKMVVRNIFVLPRIALVFSTVSLYICLLLQSTDPPQQLNCRYGRLVLFSGCSQRELRFMLTSSSW